MAYTAYRFVPLTDSDNPDAPFRDADAQAQRLAAFCAAYADPDIKPSDVLHNAANLRELVAFIEREAAAGDPAQQAVLARGDVLIYQRDIAHIEQLAKTGPPSVARGASRTCRALRQGLKGVSLICYCQNWIFGGQPPDRVLSVLCWPALG